VFENLFLDFFLVVKSKLTNGNAIAHADGPLDLVREERLVIDLVVLETTGSGF